MRNRDFTGSDHADNYLRNSVIRLGAEPIYVLGVTSMSGDGLIYSSLNRIDPSGGDKRKVSIKDEDIDMNPVPLGFVNFGTFIKPYYAYSVARTPQRAWKVGLTTGNMYILNGDISHKTLMFSEAFRKTVVNEFPSVEECIRNMKEEHWTAFSRRFAIGDGKLWHHLIDEAIGSVYNKKELKLNTKYAFLTEALEEDIK